MLREVQTLTEYIKKTAPAGRLQRAATRFVEMLEQDSNIRIFTDAQRAPRAPQALAEHIQLLKEAGIISAFSEAARVFPDEPPICAAGAQMTTGDMGGGLSINDSMQAGMAALAESLERFIWSEETDYFSSPVHGTYDDLTKNLTLIHPDSFVGMSHEKRMERPEVRIDAQTKFLWVQGKRLGTDAPVHIPAQMISKKHAVEQIRTKQEPLIRFPISTGLATGRTKVEALLGGVLEVIERDAFMIMWMNTLSLPCIQIDSILTSNEVLAELHRTCARYLLSIKYVQLITDAPAHVVMAVVSDESSLSTPHPYTSVGLCASSSLTRACEKALLEALRGRKNARARLAKHPEWLMKKPSEVYHTERGVYWCALERKPALTFLTAGQAIVVPEAVWEKDSEEAYLERLIAWANEKQYDIVSVSLTDSHKNPTQWHIENVCIPQLQPMHQRESYIYDSGKRLKSIPELFGYKPRVKPFLEHPHPFV